MTHYEIPGNFIRKYSREGFSEKKMRDEIYLEKGIRKEQMREDVERVIKFLKEKVFMKVGA